MGIIRNKEINVMQQLKLSIYQMNAVVGDLAGNCAKLLEQIEVAKAESADIFIAPELALCGYPPEDLLLREDFYQQLQIQIMRFKEVHGITLVIACPIREAGLTYNSVLIFHNGKSIGRYDKALLPNYGVFDECRYFTPGKTGLVINSKGINWAIVICEDLWSPLPVAWAKKNGADLILSINASPFTATKFNQRLAVVKQRVQEVGLGLVYVNMVGGQDEVIFDGASFAVNQNGELQFLAPAFQSGNYQLSFSAGQFNGGLYWPYPTPLEAIYQGLVLSLQDYINKAGGPKVILGLSGGIDSALTLAIAVDALGPSQVHTIMMPSPYTADISIADAREMAQGLSVAYAEIKIEPLMQAFTQALALLFSGYAEDSTEENVQARIRGTLLMALANKFSAFVLTTGNKSELSTGYCTLYGDMVGAFAPLKDVSKTLVYELARWRNSVSPVIPERIIKRPPSAELRNDQCDQDSLPEYDILDAILQNLVEQGLSAEAIIAQGYPASTVHKVATLLQKNEYKRRQAALGPKITTMAFARDWRYPITNKFKL